MDQILVKEEVEGDVPDGMLTEDIPQSGFNAPNQVYLSSPTPTLGFFLKTISEHGLDEIFVEDREVDDIPDTLGKDVPQRFRNSRFFALPETTSDPNSDGDKFQINEFKLNRIFNIESVIYN